jgi:hypothetical protein
MTYGIAILLLLLGMLFFNALLIRGINLVMQGSTEIRPDGEEINHGKIGYPIRKYFDQGVTQKIYYRDNELRKLLLNLKMKLPHLMQYREIFHAGIYVTNEQLQNMVSNKSAIYMQGGEVSFDVEDQGEIIQIYFYKEYKEYRFPKWFRMTMYDCPPCQSTVYGAIFYWVFMLFILKFDFTIELFSMYLFYWLSLAYTNHLIERR